MKITYSIKGKDVNRKEVIKYLMEKYGKDKQKQKPA